MSLTKNSNLVPVICNVYFSPIEDVDSIFSGTDRFHQIVVFNSGKSWQEIYFTPGTAEFNEKPKDNDAGTLFEQSLKFIFPGEDESNASAFDQVMDRPVLVKMQYSNGILKILGTKEIPARLSLVSQVTPKSTGAQFEFNRSAPEKAQWLTP